jgi:type VI secretion system secreted protein Hcp
VVKQYDKASPKLAKHCASGNHIASAQLKRCENGDCRSYELKDVVISSVTITSDGGGSATEQLTLNYAKIEFDYKPQSTLRESPSRPSLGPTSSGPAKPKPN